MSLSLFHIFTPIGRRVCLCWGDLVAFGCFSVSDLSFWSHCLTMTILVQFNDCHCCNDARSLVQKEKTELWLQWTWAWLASVILFESLRSKRALCIYTIILLWSGLRDNFGWLCGKRSCPGLRHPPTRRWTNPPHFVSGWDVCRKITYSNGQLRVPIHLQNITMSSWRGSKCSEGLTSSESVVVRFYLVYWVSSCFVFLFWSALAPNRKICNCLLIEI